MRVDVATLRAAAAFGQRRWSLACRCRFIAVLSTPAASTPLAQMGA